MRRREALEQHNVALRVIMDQRRSDLEEHKRIVADGIRQLVFPILDRLAATFSDRPETALFDVVIQTLNDIVGAPVEKAGEALDYSQGLTRREHEVLQLVRAGRTTDEIARDSLSLSGHRHVPSGEHPAQARAAGEWYPACAPRGGHESCYASRAPIGRRRRTRSATSG